MLIFGLGAVGTGGSAPAPGGVTGLSLVSATPSSLTIAFVAPSSGSIAWNIRQHGASTWSVATGAFGSSTATITGPGLAASTTYDVQAVANGIAAELDNISTAAAPPAPTGAANRYDLILDQSAVAPGATVTGAAYPNGLWPTTSGNTITLSNGTVINLPSSGSAPATFSFTAGSAGEVSLTATNNAGLLNPYPAPLNVFASGNGSAQAITASLPRGDMVTYQRDSASGNPAGFSASWARGWGEVWFTLAQSGPGLFVRLYDALSSGASASVGTGTALTGIVQVAGAFSAGPVRALLPAGPYIYYADVATDAAFTNPVRVARRFRVGVVLGIFSRSQECGVTRQYADTTAYPLIYAKTAVCTHGNLGDAEDGQYWFLEDHVGTNANSGGEGSSSGAEELGRLMEAQLGVCVGVTGLAATGGNFDDMVAADGTPCTGFAGTVANAVGGKLRYVWTNFSGWSGSNSNYPTETPSVLQARYVALVQKLHATYPALAVIAGCVGASGWFGQDGSRATGYTRNQMLWLGMEATMPSVVSKESYLWNEFVSGHASQGARVNYVRPSFRLTMAAEVAVMGGLQQADRGPRLAASGTVSGRNLVLSYTNAVGATLQAVGASYSNPSVTYDTASPAEIATLFSVFAAGGSVGNGTAIKIDTATIDTSAKTITLALTGTTGVTFVDGSTGAMPSGFTVHFAADFGLSNGSLGPSYSNGALPKRGVMLADDRLGSNGIPFGWHMRPALDIPVS